MGRKSLADERINQVIDAFEQCIVQYGLSGATLQRTAEQAGVNIGIIHHYIGNRDDLLRAMVHRFAEKTRQETEMFVKTTPVELRLPHLLHILFEETGDTHIDRIMNELFIAGYHDDFIRGLLQEINQLYEDLIAAEIRRASPHLTAVRCQELAFTLLSLAYGMGLLVEIGFDSKQRATVLQSAQLLLQTATNQNV